MRCEYYSGYDDMTENNEMKRRVAYFEGKLLPRDKHAQPQCTEAGFLSHLQLIHRVN